MMIPLWAAPFMVIGFIAVAWSVEMLFIYKNRSLKIWLALAGSLAVWIPSMLLLFGD